MRAPFFKIQILFLVILFLVSSCSPFKPKPRTSPEGKLPKTYSLYTEGEKKPEKWWKDFRNKELNALIEEALSGSFSLKEAWARLKQAEALAVQSGSGLYPELSATSGASYSRQKSNGKTGTVKEYLLGLTSSYELDLWGRIRSEQEAARLEVTATREDVNTAAITLAAEVAENWINILSQRMQKHLLEKQLETNETYLELVELRFRKSIVSALDVYQQKQVVEQVKAEIPLVEAQEQLFMHQLALLLGKPPRTELAIHSDNLPEAAALPSTGLPTDLLASRPDVRAAGLRLQAADWQVAAARADRLPTLSLTGEASYGAARLKDIFDNWLLNLAGNLAMPVLDGKRRAAEVDRTKAVTDENLSVYRRTVLTAVKEVEDALVSEKKQVQHIKALTSEIDAAKKALEEARERYLKGVADYLPVLTQILTVQGLERDLIQRKSELLVMRVDLYLALGGTWTDKLIPIRNKN